VLGGDPDARTRADGREVIAPYRHPKPTFTLRRGPYPERTLSMRVLILKAQHLGTSWLRPALCSFDEAP
jgi:hypothetical protein